MPSAISRDSAIPAIFLDANYRRVFVEQPEFDGSGVYINSDRAKVVLKLLAEKVREYDAAKLAKASLAALPADSHASSIFADLYATSGGSISSKAGLYELKAPPGMGSPDFAKVRRYWSRRCG
jgi:hypothetical protein